MSSDRVKALLARLEAFPEDASFDEVVSGLVLDPAIAAAERQCALTRWFDSALFQLLCADLERKPEYKTFSQSANVRGRPDRWTVDGAVRQRHLEDWQKKTPDEWRAWNDRLFDYFLKQYRSREVSADTQDLQLDVLYHAAACFEPARGVALFRQWYGEAEDRFDLAQMNALLEILRLQESWRGQELSQEWLNYRRYYSARTLFLDDYYSTGAYFYREGPYLEFKKVLDPDRPAAGDPWIFHIHATGGMGKTMFLRWLISRKLLPHRIPCARVDFDDYDLRDLVAHPFRILTRILEQWVEQVPGTLLGPLLLYLRRASTDPTWNRSVVDEVHRQLRGAGLTTPMVVVLDTLEEAALSATKWLEECVSAIRRMRESLPSLKLVLSGRYDIGEVSDTTLKEGEFVSYDLPHFDDDEARSYLKLRGVPEGKVLDAIVLRAAVDDTSGDENATAAKLLGRNPFKLALFAEIVLNRPEITETEVMELPRADIAYLMERVIIRIKSQPLRWLIRFGAIARRLTVEFVEQVLLPPLRRALRGEEDDDANRPEYPGVWQPQPELANVLTADDLWKALRSYVRDRGWISLVTVEGRAELRFHPEVVNPTRELLRSQRVVLALHQQANEYFEEQSRPPPDKEVLTLSEVEALVRNLCDAVFHRFQMEGPAAEQYWLGKIADAERFGSAYALPVASEVYGRDYAKAQRKPLPGVSSVAVLAAAHREAAALLLADAGIAFSDAHPNWSNFNQRIEMAELIERDASSRFIPPALRALNDAYRTDDIAARAALLNSALESAADADESFFLELHLGLAWRILRSPDAPVHFRKALAVLPNTRRSGVGASSIYLELADFYSFEGQHSAVLDCLRGARNEAQDQRALAAALDREARYALDTRDYRTASKVLSALRRIPLEALPSRNTAVLLDTRLALLRGEVSQVLDKVLTALERNPSDFDRARLEDLYAEACALRFQFRDALNGWGTASSYYEKARIPTGPAWCALVANLLRAKWMGDMNKADTLMNAAATLPGMADSMIYVETQLLRAYISFRRGKLEDARAIVADLLKPRSREWPPVLRGKTRVFGLISGLADAIPDYLEELLETVADTEPIGQRLSLFEWTEHFHRTVNVPPSFLARLLPLMGADNISHRNVVEGAEEFKAMETAIVRADIFRIFGRFGDAVDTGNRLEKNWTRDKEEGDLFRSWRLNRLRLRLRGATDYAGLADRVRGTELDQTPLGGAIALEAAFETLERNGDPEKAAQWAESAAQDLEDEEPNIWQARLLELRASLAPPAEAVNFRARARDLYGTLGEARYQGPSEPAAAFDSTKVLHAPSPASRPEITVAEAPAFLKDTPRSFRIEKTIDLMISNWVDAARELSHTLGSTPELRGASSVTLHVPEKLDFLPFELAPALLDCGAVSRSNYPLAARHNPPLQPLGGTITVIRSERWQAEVAFATSSGFEVESIYHYRAPKVTLDVQFNPKPIVLEAQLIKTTPALIHIAGVVRESSAGVYLDFESSQSRGLDYDRGSSYAGKPADLIFDPDRLDRVLGRLPLPPFVILQILRPENLTEALRMLMLRNQFAAQLFRLGHVRGVLAAGLAAPHEVGNLTERLVITAVANHRPAGEVLMALREELLRPSFENLTLDQVLPRFAAALWLNDPSSPVYV